MIVSGRARWIIVLAFLAVAAGLARQNAFFVQLAVACLVWIFLEWLVFRYRVDVYLRSVRVDREVAGSSGPARVLWETCSANVTTTVSLPGDILPTVNATMHDLLPTNTELLTGHPGRQLRCGHVAQDDTQIHYEMRATNPGMVEFTGVRCVLSDLHGFFYAERFIACPQRLRVLPLAVHRGTISAVRKDGNVLPPPGEHLMSKPGVGSELMEIREYVPGDPPRSIAWKVSARRDELMSKQFESEVPVRCQLFVDMSRAVRLGYPGPCLGGRLVSLAATVSTALSSHRDPVGLSIFDGRRFQISNASANRKAVFRMIDQLAVRLNQPIDPVPIASKDLVRSGYDIARIRYPAALQYAHTALASWWPSRPSWRLRVRLAAVLCDHFRLGRLAMGQLVDNDQVFSYWLQRFHTDHGAPYTGSLFDSQGAYLFDDREKIDQLAKLLHRAAIRGRDNELFVVMAELTDTAYDLQPLIRAIRFAKARHHRVVMLLAWPARMPIPRKTALSFDQVLTAPNGATEFLLERRQKEHAFVRLRGELAKMRVPVVAAADTLATPMILRQMEILRSGRAVA